MRIIIDGSEVILENIHSVLRWKGDRRYGSEIIVGNVYSAPRWKGDRQVTGLGLRKIPKGLEIFVHYWDMRTHRTGNSPLGRFSSSCSLTPQFSKLKQARSFVRLMSPKQ